MDADDIFSNLKDAVRTHGAKSVQSHYVSKRERALDLGKQDEADFWEERRRSVRSYVARRRFRYNVLSFSVGAALALLPTGYVWLEGQDPFSTTLTFAVITAVLYMVIRFIDRLLAWIAGWMLLAAIVILGWEGYIWLRKAEWLGLSVADGFAWIGITPSFVTIEGWVGISRIVNDIFVWFLDSPLPAGCIYLGMLFFIIAEIIENFDVPKLKEEEDI